MLTWVLLDAPLNDLCDVLECSSILLEHVVTQSNAVAGVCTVASHLEDRVEVTASLSVTLLLQTRGGQSSFDSEELDNNS